MTHLLWQIFVAACYLTGLLIAYSLAVRLVKTTVTFFRELVEGAVEFCVGVFFLVVIVPPVWLWEKAKRPMWRTLTPRELEDLVKGYSR